MRLLIIFLGCIGFMTIPRLVTPTPTAQLATTPPTPGVQLAMDYFTTQSRTFAANCTQLRKTLESPNPSRTVARQRLIECRCQYKKIEAFLEYFFRSSSTIYNRPPKFEAEEPDMEYQSPIGLQVIESLLYDTHPDHKTLLDQAKAVESSASDLPALLYDFKATDRQLLESLRLELIRIIALDITGYEAPLLKTGIRESRAALEAFSLSLQPYLQKSKHADSLQYFLNKTVNLLKDDQPFRYLRPPRVSKRRGPAPPTPARRSSFVKKACCSIPTKPSTTQLTTSSAPMPSCLHPPPQ